MIEAAEVSTGITTAVALQRGHYAGESLRRHHFGGIAAVPFRLLYACLLQSGASLASLFRNGQTAMIYAWGHMEGTMKEKYPDIDYGVFATPTFTKGTPFAYDRYNGESTPGVNKNQSKEQQAVAQDFIKYLLANDDYIREAVTELNSFPAKVTLQDDKEILAEPVMAAIQPRVKRLIWPGPAPSTVESSGTIAFQNVFQNGMSIDKALKEAQNQMDADMKNSDFVSLENKYAFFDEHK